MRLKIAVSLIAFLGPSFYRPSTEDRSRVRQTSRRFENRIGPIACTSRAVPMQRVRVGVYTRQRRASSGATTNPFSRVTFFFHTLSLADGLLFGKLLAGTCVVRGAQAQPGQLRCSLVLFFTFSPSIHLYFLLSFFFSAIAQFEYRFEIVKPRD